MSDLRAERNALSRAAYCRERYRNDMDTALRILSIYDSKVWRITDILILEGTMERLQSAKEWLELANLAQAQASDAARRAEE